MTQEQPKRQYSKKPKDPDQPPLVLGDDVEKTLPTPEKIDDESKIARGREATAFMESSEGKYFHGLIDRQIISRQLEILDLPMAQIERFKELRCEIRALESLKNASFVEQRQGETVIEQREKA